MRSTAFRIDIIRNGVTAGTLDWSDAGAPNIMFDAGATIKASLQGRFHTALDTRLLSDELRPVLIINGDEFPMGVFRVSTLSEAHTATGVECNIEAYDKCWQLECICTENIRHFAKGENYLVIVKQLLTEAGIDLTIITPTTATLQCDREDWDIGTNYLEIINTLLQEINYNDLWFDAQGIARVEPATKASANNIKYTYGTGGINGALPVSDDTTQETDLFNKPNVFVAVCSNPDLDTVLTAVAVNDSPMSEASTVRRGLRITKTVQVDNIASQDELQAYAEQLKEESLFSDTIMGINTLVDGWHNLKDTVAVSLPNREGIYEETAWSFTMRTGELMNHSLRKVATTV